MITPGCLLPTSRRPTCVYPAASSKRPLQDEADMTTGRLDTRFSGPSMDPLVRPRSTTAIRGNQLGVYFRVQRLRAQAIAIRTG